MIEILCLLDRSHSMVHLMPEAVSAFNEFVKGQQELDEEDEVVITLAAFDNRYKVIWDKIPLMEAPELLVGQVEPRGMTSLADSIGLLVSSAEGNDVILLIQTDGMENSSKELTMEQAKHILKEKEELGWDINFIGVGLDAFNSGISLGVSKTILVPQSSEGMNLYSTSMQFASTTYRKSKNMFATTS